MSGDLTSLVARLESVTTRLEAVASGGGGGAEGKSRRSQNPCKEITPFICNYNRIYPSRLCLNFPFRLWRESRSL